MLRVDHILLIIVVLVSWSFSPYRHCGAQDCIQAFSDEFEDGTLDPWLDGSTCGSATVTDGHLLLSRGECSGDVRAQLDGSQYRLCGNFDLRIRFDLLGSPPPTSGVRWIAMRIRRAGDLSGVVTIERFVNTLGEGIYKAFTTDAGPYASRSPLTTDTTGRFRLVRIGSYYGVFYEQRGEWVLLRSSTATTEDLTIRLEAGGNTSEAYDAAFDDLEITPLSEEIETWPFSPNGHFYEFVLGTPPESWLGMSSEAAKRGGYLATLTTPEEHEHVAGLASRIDGAWNGNTGPAIGGIQGKGSWPNCDAEPAGSWRWVTGEPVDGSEWASGQPDDGFGEDDYMMLWGQSDPTWNDIWNGDHGLLGYMIEIDRLVPPLLVHVMPGYPNAPHTTPAQRRPVRGGVATDIWGSANRGDGTTLGSNYTWSFSANPNVTITTDGDGLSGIIIDDKFIAESVTFALLGGSTEEIVRATLTIEFQGRTRSRFVELLVVDPTDPATSADVDVTLAIEDALRALYLRQGSTGTWARWEHELFPSVPELSDVGPTAVVLWAFQNQGHSVARDPIESVYADTVRRGMTAVYDYGYVETNTSTWPWMAVVSRGAIATGTSDLNGNCQALRINLNGNPQSAYETAITCSTIVSSGAPDYVVPAGRWAGLSYKTVVEDLIDVFGSLQASGSITRGGWRYSSSFGDADMSHHGFFLVAMEGAEDVFGVNVPDWIKHEQERMLINTQANQLGAPFRYLPSTSPGADYDHAHGTTGAGLTALRVVETEGPFVVPGDLLDDVAPPHDGVEPKRSSALTYLGEKWNVDATDTSPADGILDRARGNRGNFYAMWAVSRGLRSTALGYGLPTGERVQLEHDAVSFDWYTGAESPSGTIAAPSSAREGYAPYLVRTQESSGDADERGMWLFETTQTPELDTAMAVMVLTPKIFPVYENTPPATDAGGPYLVECGGGVTTVELYGLNTRDSDADPLTYEWTTDCPGASIDDPTSATPTVTIDTSVAPATCLVTLVAFDGVDYRGDTAEISIADRLPPVLTFDFTLQTGDTGTFIRGDANDDGGIDIADPITSLDYLFSSGLVNCLEAVDSNGDGGIDIADPIYTLSYLFSQGPDPLDPFPSCGTVPLALGCDTFESCGFSASSAPVVTAAMAASDTCGTANTTASVMAECGSIAVENGVGFEFECGVACSLSGTGAGVVVTGDSLVLQAVATDAAGNSSVSAVDLCVAGNHPPVFTSIPTTLVDLVEPYGDTAIAADLDGDVLTYELSSAPIGMSIDPLTGSITWLPTVLDLGEHVVVLSADDGFGGTALQSYRVRVFEFPMHNQAPTIISTPPTSGGEGQPYQYDVVAEDLDGDSLAFSLPVAPVGMTIDITSGAIDWTPSAAQSGTRDVVVRAEDPDGAFGEQSFQIVVEELLNLPPAITSSAIVLATEGVDYIYDVDATDPDGDELTWSLDSAPTAMTIVPTSGLVYWLPDGTQSGDHSVVVRVTDDDLEFDTQSFMITVAEAINPPPEFTSVPVTTSDEGVLYEYDADAVDPEGEVITYTLTLSPAGMDIDSASGLITWTTTSMNAGVYSVTVVATDTALEANEQSFSIVVADTLNDPPSITSTPPTEATEGGAYSYDADATDPNGDVLTWSLDLAPLGMIIDSSSGVVNWTPDGTQSGSHDVIVRVADDELGADTQAFVITVAEAINGPPVFVSVPVTTGTEGQPYVYDADAIDTEGDLVVSYTLTIAPVGMTIDSALGVVNWTPSADQSGAHAVGIVAADDMGNLSSPQSFSVVVTEAINAPPRIVSVPLLNAEVGALYSYSIMVEDSDSTSFTYELVNGPASATLSIAGLLEWTPSTTGVSPMTIRVTDDGGLQATQFFAVSVREVLDITPPLVVVTANPAIVSIGDTVSVAIVATDDSAIDSVIATINGAPLTLQPDGTADFVASTSGLFIVEALAVDAGGLGNTASAEFRVRSGVDDGAPVVTWTSPIAESLVDGPIDVIGTADDGDLVFYELEISRDAGATFAPFHRGESAVIGDIVGQVRPGDFLPGIAQFRICAEDTWGNRSCSDPVALDLGRANASPGFHRFALLDGFVDVAGIPLAIRRVYDVRKRAPGDFGFNWSLESTQAKLETTRTMGAEWAQTIDSSDPLFPVYELTSSVAHRVTVSLPDGSVHRFEMVPLPQQQALFPIDALTGVEFVALPGTTSELFPSSFPLFVEPSSPGPVELVDGGFQPFEPGGYTLELRDGRALIFTQEPSTSEYLLTRVTEPNGNYVDVSPTGLIHSSGASVSLTRDIEDRITSLTTPAGATRTYTYDGAGDLCTATDFEGYTTEYVYDDDHNLTQIIDPRGFTPGTLLYDDRGRIAGLVDGAGNQITLTLDEVANQHIVTDRLGNTSVVSYDDRSNVVSLLDPELNETTFTYDSEDRQTSATDPLGNTQSWEYDPTGLLTTYTDAMGGEITFTYDSAARQLSRADQIGRVTSYEYDAAGNQTATVTASGERFERTFDAEGRVLDVEDPLGGVVSWDRDPLDDRITTLTDSLGNATDFVTNERGQIVQQSYTKDGELAVLSTEIDANGMTRSSTLPTGATGTIGIGAGGYPVAVTDFNGVVQQLVYNAAGDLAGISQPGAPMLLFQRDVEQQVTQVEDPAGGVTERVLDSSGRPTSIQAPNGRTASVTFDSAGRISQEMIADRAALNYDHDDLGRVTSRTTVHDSLGPVTRSYEYDAASQLTARIDEAGGRTEFAHDLEGRVTTTTFADLTTTTTTHGVAGPVQIVDELGETIDLQHNVGGQLISVTNRLGETTAYTYGQLGGLETATTESGNQWDLTWDLVGALSSQTYPWGGTLSWQRDAVARIVSIGTPTGESITREYDSRGRLSVITAGLAEPELFTYDATGTLAVAVDDIGATTYTREPSGQVSRIDQTNGPVEYAYDEHGRVESLITPAGLTSFEYDGQGHLSSVIDSALGTTSYEYDAVGGLATIHHTDGSTTVFTRDLRGRVVTLVTTDASLVVIRDEIYDHDLAGNLLSASGLAESVVYQYDAASRVTNESWTGLPELGSLAYSYDSDWQLTTMGARTLGYDGTQRLTSDGLFTSYVYDSAGRPTERSTGSTTEILEYDAYGRLRRLERSEVGSTTVIELGYDYLDLLREIRVDGSVVRTLLWETQLSVVPRLLEERAGDGTLLRRYVHGLRPIGVEADVNVLLHQDPLGSTRLVTDSTGVPIETPTFGAYGGSATPVGTSTSLLFAGELYIPELDLYFLRSRFYDPTAGRFLTPDKHPVSPTRPTSFTPFLYAAANPVRYTDPLGTISLPEINIGRAIVGQLASVALPRLPLPTEAIARGLVGDLATRIVNSREIIGGDFSVGVGSSAGGVLGVSAGVSAGVKVGTSHSLIEVNLKAGASLTAGSQGPKSRGSVSVEIGLLSGTRGQGNPTPPGTVGSGVSLKLPASGANFLFVNGEARTELGLLASATSVSIPIGASLTGSSACGDRGWCESFTFQGPAGSIPTTPDSVLRAGFDGSVKPDGKVISIGFEVSMNLFWATFDSHGLIDTGGVFDSIMGYYD